MARVRAGLFVNVFKRCDGPEIDIDKTEWTLSLERGCEEPVRQRESIQIPFGSQGAAWHNRSEGMLFEQRWSSEKGAYPIANFVCRVLIADVMDTRALESLMRHAHALYLTRDDKQERNPTHSSVALVRQTVEHIRAHTTASPSSSSSSFSNSSSNSSPSSQANVSAAQLDWETICARTIRYALLQNCVKRSAMLPTYDLIQEEDVTLHGVGRHRPRRRVGHAPMAARSIARKLFK